MNILVSNDDGFDSPGLAALYEVAAVFGRPIVVAPIQPHSLKGHAITTNAPISIEKRQNEHFGPCYVCDAAPADCVRLALKHLPIGPIELVLSGINRGANAGVDVFYSGTVAAAREAAFLGLPAIAISQFIGPTWSDNWTRTTDLAIRALRKLLSNRGASRRPGLTNVNLPDPAADQDVHGIKFCPLTIAPLPINYEPTHDPSVTQHQTQYAGRYYDRPAPEGSDFYYLKNNWITLTPLQLDHTDHERLPSSFIDP